MNTLGPTPTYLLVSAVLLQAALDARSEIEADQYLKVREGEWRIRIQREIVHRLAGEGQDTELAIRTLRNFERAQELILQVARSERSIQTRRAQLARATDSLRTTRVRSSS